MSSRLLSQLQSKLIKTHSNTNQSCSTLYNHHQHNNNNNNNQKKKKKKKKCTKISSAITNERAKFQVPLPKSGALKPSREIENEVERFPWKGGLEPCEDHYERVKLTADVKNEQKVPKELKGGKLYRLGPGRARLGKKKYAHWFDGDGCIHEVSFTSEGEVYMRSAFVRTERYKAQERKVNSFVANGGKEEDQEVVAARGAWTQASDAMDNLGKFPTNPGNTSPIVFNDTLLALCEGGPPIEIDKVTLKTKGEYKFKNADINGGFPMGFAAHSKIDANDGYMYAWGLASPPAIGHRVAKISPKGEVLKTASVPLPDPFGFFLLHDACDTENYIVFVIIPWKASLVEIMPALIGYESFGHSFSYDSSAKTRIVVMRKSDLSVALEVDVDNFSSYHNAGAYEDENGDVHAIVCKLDGSRKDLEKNFADMYASTWTEKQYNHLYDVHISMKKKLVLSETKIGGKHAKPMEFPVISPLWSKAKTKSKPEFIYTLCFGSRGGGYFDTIQKVKTESHTSDNDDDDDEIHLEYVSKPGHFPSEVAFVPKTSSTYEDDGFLVFLEYSAIRHASDVVVLDAKSMLELFRWEAPYHVPYTFHGHWEKNS